MRFPLFSHLKSWLLLVALGAPQAWAAGTLTVLPNPATYGRAISLIISALPVSSGGKVTFYDGTDIIGISNIFSGTAGISTTLLRAGTHQLVARFDGAGGVLPEYSNTVSLVVNERPSSGFPAVSTLFPGFQPSWVTLADFNGDGKLDLAVVLSGNAVVALGAGDGTFPNPVTVSTGQSPIASVSADFNGDGIADLAVTSADGVDILIGNGNATFASRVGYPVGMNPLQVVAGDFNQDGIVDLATANLTSGDVSVLIGNGDGTFHPAVAYRAGNGTSSLVVADFNGDGKPDIAAVNGFDNNIGILLGNGDGTFGLITTFPVGMQPVAIDTADFNGDGRADLVVANAADNTVGILLGNGNGTFLSMATYLSGILPAALALADFNGDGKLDIAVANTSDQTFSILVGNGDGTFHTSSAYPAGNNVLAIAAGDLNGDGVADIVVADIGDFVLNPGALGVLLGLNCNVTATPASLAFDQNGNPAVPVIVTSTNTACTWNVTSDSNWLILSTNVGAGNSTLFVQVAPNASGSKRVGNLSIGGQTVPVTEWGTTQTFSDVTPQNYFFDAVNLLKNRNITAGCGFSVFCPLYTVTRDEMAVFMVRSVLSGNDNFSYSTTPYFQDVPPNAFAFKWIQKLFELGITAGCAQGYFCPGFPVTRDEAAIFIIRARYGATAQFDDHLAPFFTDVPSGYFAFPWIQRLKQDGITAGCGPTQFCPGLTLSRGDAAVFIMRGAFNQLLPAGTPVISSISPAALSHPSTGTFLISGFNTHFVQGVTQFRAIPGITVNSLTVTSPTTLTAQISTAQDSRIGPVSIFIQTGNEEAVLPSGLTIQ